MNNAATTAPADINAPKFYALMVKGSRGRKWFRADSARSGDVNMMIEHARDMGREYGAAHGLRFTISALPEDHARPIAPNKYRPWDTTTGDADADVDLDALGDDEL
jgi:hypothetical protein